MRIGLGNLKVMIFMKMFVKRVKRILLRESIDEDMLCDGNDGNEEGFNEAEDSVTDDSDDSGSDDDEANMMEAQAEKNHRAEIRIGGSVTCMQIEDLDEAVFCIAPGEGSIPKYILMDEKFERLAFPDLFPFGSGDYDKNLVRERELNWRRYINQEIIK